MSDATVSSSAVYKPGDQVIVHSLVKASELNNALGEVMEEQRSATDQRYVVRLQDGKQIAVKAENLKKKSEPIVFSGLDSQEDVSLLLDRDPVQDGVLDNGGTGVGIHLVRIFHLMRFVVGKYILEDKNVTDINKMSALPVAKSMELNAFAIQHWDIVYPRLKYYLESQHPFMNPNDRDFAIQAINSKKSMKCWGQGIHQEFWFVGRDYEGTYVVSDSNKTKVYQIVGIMKKGPNYKQPGDPMSLNKIPTKMMITVVPWNGRLLYDSTILVPPDQLVRTSSPMQAQQLHMVALQRIQDGSVIHSESTQKESQSSELQYMPLN
jgi:hypothetical protein